MTAMDWVFLLLSLAVGVGIFAFIIAPSAPLAVGESPTLTLSFPPRAEINTPISGTIIGTHLQGETLLFFDGNHTQSLSCTADPCTLSLTLTYSAVGTRTLEIRSASLRAEQRIQLISSQRVCIDGTPEGSCATPPFRCVDAQLLPDCDACGCPAAQSCESGACVNPPIEYTITALALEGTAYTTSPATIRVSLVPMSVIPITGTFVLFLDEYTASTSTPLASTPHTISLSTVTPNSPYTFTFSQLMRASTTHLGARWYPHGGTYDAATLLAQTESRTPIQVETDTLPPAAPGTLSYSVEGDVLSLFWEPSSSADAATYRVYQQNTATGGFTAYTIVHTTPHLTYSLARPSGETAFVIRAIDGAGNESPASAPLVVPAS